MKLLQVNIRFYIKPAFVFIILFIVSNTVVAKSSGEAIIKKADFILEAAFNIYYNQPISKDEYKIGIYGRDSDAKSVYERMLKITSGLTIDKKPITVSLFKYMRAVEPIDVLYISGETKIRLADLNEKLPTRNYSLITENYPFGMSSINIGFDPQEQLIYEIQDVTLRKNGAKLRSKILENRRRIATAAQWNAKMEGAKTIEGGSSAPKGKQSTKNTNIESFTDKNTVSDSIKKTRLGEKQWTELEKCETNSKNAIALEKKKFRWLITLALLTIAGLCFYIFKLRKKLE